MLKPSDYLAVLTALREEQGQPAHLQSQGVIELCRAWLAMFEPPLWTPQIERTLNGQ